LRWLPCDAARPMAPRWGALTARPAAVSAAAAAGPITDNRNIERGMLHSSLGWSTDPWLDARLPWSGGRWERPLSRVRRRLSAVHQWAGGVGWTALGVGWPALGVG